MANQISILGFAGSLRKGSYNKALLRAAMEVLPKDAKLEIFDLEGIPHSIKTSKIIRPKRLRTSKQKLRLQTLF